MKRRAVVASALGLCLIATSCTSKSASDNPARPDNPPDTPNTPEAPVSATGGDVGMLFGAAGYSGAVGIAVWPEQWSKLSTFLGAVAASAPPAVRSDIEEVEAELTKRFPSAWSAIRALAANAHKAARKLPEKLDGLDASRPIVASLFAPMGNFDELGLAVIERAGGGGQPGPAATVHRFAIPADDSHAVRDALVAGFTAGGLNKRSEQGARVVLGDDHLVVSVGAAKLWVEVVALTGERLDTLTAADIPASTAKPTAADELFAADEPSLVRVQIRAQRIADPAMHGGMRKVDSALGSVEATMRPLLFMAGMSEILSTLTVTDPAGAAQTDIIAEIPASSPEAVHAAILLTPGGVAAFNADTKLASGATVSFSDLDRDAVIAAAPMPPAFQGAKAQDVARLFHECGWGCMAYSLGANGLSMLRPVLTGDPRAKKEIEEMLGQVGPAARARLSLNGAVLAIEGLGEGESRFRKAKVAPAAVAQSDSAKCYFAAMRGVRKALGATTSVDPQQLPAIVAAIESDNRANLDCAAKDSAYAERVGTMRKIIAAIAKQVGKN